MRGSRLVLAVLVPTAAACALVADLGDRTLGARDAGRDAERPLPPSEEEEPPPVVSDGGPPSFCDGIVLYASFDRELTGDRGDASVEVVGNAALTAEGMFGGGLSLVTDAAAPGLGAAVFYRGTEVWPENEGSLSIWYRAVPGGGVAPVLYRPVASLPPEPLQTSGLAFFLRNDTGDVTGLVQRNQTPVLMFPASAVGPFLRPNAYNQFFTAWRRGAPPTAYLALNGATGEAFADTTGIGVPDAAVGGELRAPFRAFTSIPWESDNAPIALRVGGLGTNAPEGTVDDLTVWNRILSFEEARAVYAAGTSVGLACNIRR